MPHVSFHPSLPIRISMIALFVTLLVIGGVALGVDLMDKKIEWKPVAIKAATVLASLFFLVRWLGYGIFIDDERVTLHGWVWTGRIPRSAITSVAREQRVGLGNRTQNVLILRDAKGNSLADMPDGFACLPQPEIVAEALGVQVQ